MAKDLPVFDSEDNMLFLDLLLDVVCFQKDERRKVVVCTTEELLYAPTTIKHFVQLLYPMGFRQIDKNKILNVSLVEDYKQNKIYVGNTVFTLARDHKKSFEELYFSK